MSFRGKLTAVDSVLLDLLGEAVTYSPSVGIPVDVTGVFDSSYQHVNAGTAGVSSTGPAVWLMLSGLPSDPRDDNATITYDGTEYSIREAQPDGTGGVILLLHRA